MRKQIAIAAAASVVLLVLLFMLLVRPVGGKIAETRTQLDAAKSEESDLRNRLRQLQQARANAPAVQAELAKFDLLLPRTADIPTFIRQIQDAADLSGVGLESIAPSPPVAVAAGPGTDPALVGRGVFQINVVLTANGGFFRIKSFLQRVESLQRVVTVNNLTLSPGGGEETAGELSSTITLQMFVVNPSTPVPGSTPAPRPTGSPSPSPSPSPTSGGGGGGPATPTPTSS